MKLVYLLIGEWGMKRSIVNILLLFLILVTPVTTLGQESDITADPGVKLISADESGVLFELGVPQYEIISLKSGDDDYEQIVLPMNENVVRDLTNQFPQINVLLGVPAEASIDLEILEDETSTVKRALGLHAPMQPQRINETLEPGILVSSSVRSLGLAQLPSPGNLVVINSDAWIRDQRVIRVELRPIQYNPSDTTLTWHKRMLIRVSFYPIYIPVCSKRDNRYHSGHGFFSG